MADRIQNRRDTKARWAEVNPILLEGEHGDVLDDPNLYKVGDGVKRWNELPFRGYNGTVVNVEGVADNIVMSQKGVTDALKKRDDKIVQLEQDQLLLDASINLFNKCDVVINKQLNPTDGAIKDAIGWGVSNYMHCKPNTWYCVSGVKEREGLSFFDSNKNPIQYKAFNLGAIKTPSNCAYIVVQLYSATQINYSELMISEGIYNEYYSDYNVVYDKSVKGLHSIEQYISLQKNNCNITFVDGYFINQLGNLSKSSSHSISKLLKANGSVCVMTAISGGASIACYDENLKYVKSLSYSDNIGFNRYIIDTPYFILSTSNKSEVVIKGYISDCENVLYLKGGIEVDNSIAISSLSNISKAYITFDFKINEDIHKGASAISKTLFGIAKDGNFFNAVVRLQSPELFSEKENTAVDIVTTYPMNKYRATFGWESNVDRNVYLAARNLKTMQPVCGRPVMSIRYKADRDRSEIQDELISNKDIKVSITETHLVITNGVNTASLNIGTSKSLKALADEIESLSNDAILSKLEFEWYDIDGRSSYDLQMCDNIPLISTYPSKIGSDAVPLYDAFPFYIRSKIDESWHTFEMVIDNGKGYFQIDGQNKSVTEINIPDFINDATLFFGGINATEINNSIRNLEIIRGGTGDAEYNFTNTPNFSKIISSKSPAVLGLMMHGVFDGFEVDGQSPNFKSLGGTIPDKYRPNYNGNPANKIGLIIHPNIATSTGRMYKYFKLLKSKGYVNISYDDIAKYKSEGKQLPKRCFFTLHDDRESYIYADATLRSVYERYGYKGTFCVAINDYYTGGVATQKDVDLLLQMNINNWEVITHGVLNTEFTGKSFKFTKDSILDTIGKSNELYVKSSFWSNSSNASTPNSIMLFERYGIQLAIAVDGWYTNLFTNNMYIRRNEMCDRTLYATLASNTY